MGKKGNIVTPLWQRGSEERPNYEEKGSFYLTETSKCLLVPDFIYSQQTSMSRDPSKKDFEWLSQM